MHERRALFVPLQLRVCLENGDTNTNVLEPRDEGLRAALGLRAMRRGFL